MKRLAVVFSVAALGIIAIVLFLYLPDYTDVVVIGGGAAGMSAAIEAADSGASVILLEKMNYLGGNSLRATGGMNAVGTRYQKAAGIEDSEESYYQDTMKSGHWLNNRELVRLLVSRSASSVEWLTGLGADLSDVGRLAGHSASRTHRPAGGAPVGHEVVPVLSAGAHSAGVEIRLQNRAFDLILSRDGKRVRGVMAETRAGRHYRIIAKSVVIATGGFGASPEIYVDMDPGLRGFKTTNHPGANGDYLALIDDLDVSLVDMGYIQTHPTVEPGNGVLITEAVRGNGGILLNSRGERFVDELAFRDILSRRILEQPGKSAFLIFDSRIRDSLSATDTYFALRLISRADSVAELASIFGIPCDAAESSLMQYNRLQKRGKDTDFLRNDMPVPISEPPYYGIQVAPAVHHCMGGLRINSRAQVLDSRGEPVKGLFAAGEATGGIHAANRLGGNSLIDAVTFGRIAGNEAFSRR